MQQPMWRKSRRSDAESACVEITALNSQVVAVRDSKNPAGPVLTFPARHWRGLLADIRAGARDL